MSVRSSTGYQLERMENFSHDSNGNKLPSGEGFEVGECLECGATC